MKKENSFVIKPINNRNVGEAIKLVVRLFGSKPKDYDYPGKWMLASIAKKKDKLLYASTDCKYVKYYVGILNGKIIGVTGIYTQKDDENDSVWIAWFCVDELYRGKGYGSKLLDFTISAAKKKKKKFLKLYTSYDTDIKKAMTMYKKRGFEVIKSKNRFDDRMDNIYLRLALRYVRKPKQRL